MNELEDEPEDVQNASPVVEEVAKGEKDEFSVKTMSVSAKSEETRPTKRHRCKKEVSFRIFCR